MYKNDTSKSATELPSESNAMSTTFGLNQSEVIALACFPESYKEALAFAQSQKK